MVFSSTGESGVGAQTLRRCLVRVLWRATYPLFLEHLLLFMRALLLLALLTLTLCLSLFLQLCQTPLLPETNASP